MAFQAEVLLQMSEEVGGNFIVVLHFTGCVAVVCECGVHLRKGSDEFLGFSILDGDGLNVINVDIQEDEDAFVAAS